MSYLTDTKPDKQYKAKSKMVAGLKVRSLTGGYQHAIDLGVADVPRLYAGSGKHMSSKKTMNNLNSRTRVGFKK